MQAVSYLENGEIKIKILLILFFEQIPTWTREIWASERKVVTWPPKRGWPRWRLRPCFPVSEWALHWHHHSSVTTMSSIFTLTFASGLLQGRSRKRRRAAFSFQPITCSLTIRPGKPRPNYIFSPTSLNAAWC